MKIVDFFTLVFLHWCVSLMYELVFVCHSYIWFDLCFEAPVPKQHFWENKPMCTLIRSPHGFIVREGDRTNLHRCASRSKAHTHSSRAVSICSQMSLCVHGMSTSQSLYWGRAVLCKILLILSVVVQNCLVYIWIVRLFKTYQSVKLERIHNNLWIGIKRVLSYEMPEVEQYMDPEIECDNRSVTRRCGKQADNEELFCLGMLTAWMVLCSLCNEMFQLDVSSYPLYIFYNIWQHFQQAN